MSNAIYAALARQEGLMREMQVVANNLANSSTTGYKSDRAVFAEMIASLGARGDGLSMGVLAGHTFDLSQGNLSITGGQLDLAIQGEGYFTLETPQGERLTRAGHFQIGPEGTIINGDGMPVLGAGGNPITLPDNVSNITIADDGTISVDGQLFDQIGVVLANGPLARDTGTMFVAQGGTTPVEAPSVLQGALESSNVSPVLEIARMIEVQRAYEAGQSMLEKEDERISQLITAVRQR